MTWFDWTLVGWLTFGVLATVALVGVPRKPISPGTAVATLIINGLLVAGVLLV